MTAGNDFDDVWTQRWDAPDTPPEPWLKIEQIDGVEPLDDQFGVASPKTVPDALHAPFFGQPEPTEAEIAAAGGDPAKVPLLQTYAILDAAKVTNLPELLETSGLKHRCLFKGNAYDELKDVAPWIVQLEDNNAFTRNLFTRSDAPWHLWESEPGIYVRSGGALDDMWRHFRKFTKVQDENGKWFYFRFWEGDFVRSFLGAMTETQSRAFFGDRLVGEFIRLGSLSQRFYFISLPSTSPLKVNMTLTPEIYSAFSECTLARFWQVQQKKHTNRNTISDEEFNLLRRQIDAIGLKSAAAITALIDLCANSSIVLLDQMWARDELDRSRGMPDRIRVDRLLNLAGMIGKNGT